MMPSLDFDLVLPAAAFTVTCLRSAETFFVMAYLNSNFPLFSRVKEQDLRVLTTIEPKLMSLMGDIENLVIEGERYKSSQCYKVSCKVHVELTWRKQPVH